MPGVRIPLPRPFLVDSQVVRRPPVKRNMRRFESCSTSQFIGVWPKIRQGTGTVALCRHMSVQSRPHQPFRGYSSVGRALAWHARGRRFDSGYLHHFGDVAQTGERPPCKRTVVGSTPTVSTILCPKLTWAKRLAEDQEGAVRFRGGTPNLCATGRVVNLNATWHSGASRGRHTRFDPWGIYAGTPALPFLLHIRLQNWVDGLTA